MSGICGMIGWDGRAVGQDMARILRALEPFGRERPRQWDGGDAAFGIRMLRTVPEDIHDRQPLSGAGGRFTLVADLRLDNRDELVRNLGLPPAEAAALADSDLLLAGWQRRGPALVEHMEGEWAFALWDREERALWLCRDVQGLRPLFLHQGNGWLAFATMAQALFSLPDVETAPDPERLLAWALRMPEQGTRTCFKAVERVIPGQIVRIDAQGRTARTFWDPRAVPPLRLKDPRDYAEGLREVLTRTVASQLRGTGEIGSQLSSGYDSSAVTAAAARLLAGQGRGLTAFTRCPRQDWHAYTGKVHHADEGPLAAGVARLYPNIRHVIHRDRGESALDITDRYHRLMAGPVYDPFIFSWVHLIGQDAAARGVRVMLVGDSGNSTISYGGRQALTELLRTGRLVAWARLAARARRYGGSSLLGLLGSTFGPFIPPSAYHWLRRLSGRQAGPAPMDLYPVSAGRLEDPAVRSLARASGAILEVGPLRNRMVVQDWAFDRHDRGSMFAALGAVTGVSHRDPTGDPRVRRFCLSVPVEVYMLDGRPRWLWRQAFGSWVTRELADSPTKGLVVSGNYAKLREQRDAFLAELDRCSNLAVMPSIVDVDALRQELLAMPDREIPSAASQLRYSSRLTRGFSAAHFTRVWSRSNC